MPVGFFVLYLLCVVLSVALPGLMSWVGDDRAGSAGWVGAARTGPRPPGLECGG